MELQGKRVLVTGGDGFIGSHLVETLVNFGCEVRALVFYNSFNSWGWLDQSPLEVKKAIEVVAGDIRDPYFVKQAMNGCDIVFHLAALIAIPFSYLAPHNYVETNVNGTLNVLQAAKELGVAKVLHTSTSEVYGTAQYVPINEQHPLQGQSPYSASKIAADQMAFAFHASYDLPVTVVRPFNTYGPRQSARAVIPTIISQLASGKESIQLGSLHPTRDFNFIADTISGFIAMAQSDQVLGEVVNIGSNYEISIGQTVAIIQELMGREVEIITDDQRVRPEQSEVERLWACNEKATRLLNWTPEYASLSGFKQGLQITIDWFAEPANLSHYKTQQYNI